MLSHKISYLDMIYLQSLPQIYTITLHCQQNRPEASSKGYSQFTLVKSKSSTFCLLLLVPLTILIKSAPSASKDHDSVAEFFCEGNMISLFSEL